MYRDASRVLEKLLQGRSRKRKRGDDPRAKNFTNQTGGLKSLVFGEAIRNKAKTYAIVCETLKYKQVLDEVVQEAGLRTKDLARNEGLLSVMLYDHLFGQGIKGGGQVKRKIKEHDAELKKGLQKVLKKRNLSDLKELVDGRVKNAPKLPRYARVNTLKTDLQAVKGKLASSELEKSLVEDPHIPNVIRFPHGTDLHDHDLVKSGELILQDKSSCFSAYALASVCKKEFNLSLTDAIDATAAPGNKTSHLACYFRKVHAFDKSKNRLEVLKRRMVEAGADKVEPTCQDFLTLDPSQECFKDVRAILLDPSCSGSGMVSRMDHLLDDNEDNDGTDDRLTNLATFQKECLAHALKFPQVRMVSYSTCSIHKEENEEVVAETLKNFPDFELRPILETWPRRGLPDVGLSEEDRKCVVRVDPNEDECSGFFVAVFARKIDMLPMSNKQKKKKERRKKRKLMLKEQKKQQQEQQNGN